MMPDIYKVNGENIVGGPGRLVFAPFGTPYPARISDVMDLTAPFNLKSPWVDLGATNDGISISRGFDTEDFQVDQVSGAVETDITGWTHTLETNLAENTVENRQLALAGGTIITQAPTYGMATTLGASVGTNATIITVTSAANIDQGSWIELGGTNSETVQVSSVQGTTVYLSNPIKYAHAASDPVRPITEPGTKRIGYGTPTDVPFHTYALISQKKDGTLYMAVFRKCKISGDDKEQTFGKEKRLLPLQLTAFPDGAVANDENVYYEIEQTR